MLFTQTTVFVVRTIFVSLIIVWKTIIATNFGRPFLKRFALCCQTVVLSVCPVLSVCNVGVLWPNGWMDQNETWHAVRPWALATWC